ncbi:HesA/MoeB/ThiF family protein [Sphingomonas oryzagri]|uniref:ThiF family adenylyltransferase n=1 Tax=Sphingomonas oryzagri TaxID=3042314 RepID=A0ABT6N1T5_9SPHN|nr:ThiF family adenylyltransferase [Sphingomonas oryzagri]MDH7639240.1 ThiF family adenylyltransferase [Sphingomonas oryzagri]
MTDASSLAGYEMRLNKKGRLFRLGGRLAPAVGIRKPVNLDQLKPWYAAQVTTGPTWDQFYRSLFDCDHVFLAAENAILGFELDLPADLATGVRRGSIRKDKLRGIAGRQGSRIKLSRLGGKWAGIDRVVRRNMGTATNLEGLSVAVIGCGTIGSHLAKFLAQSGAGCGARLHLFDKDVLSEGNLGRHLLGFGDIGKLKAAAVAAELMRFHPQIDVVGHDVDALAEWRMLSRADLLIDATGEWNVQNALNEAFLSAPDARPKALLHSWVFMNGAGVQSFLNLGDKFACFRCLKPELDGAWRFPVGVEQDELDLQPATCGDGVYIPFSVDVPVIAAALTSRAAVDWAGGKPGQRLRSQVTDPAKGRHQKWQSPEPSPHCPACRDRRQ